MIRHFLTFFGFFFSIGHVFAAIQIVAVENFYGKIAKQIGGSSVAVDSILGNPNQNPHEFQTDAATVKAIASADILIYNGLGYDDWVEKLLRVNGKPYCKTIKVADLVRVKMGQNPHIWYDPETMSMLATRLAQILNKSAAAEAFEKSMQPLREKISALRGKTFGLKVTATESIFGYMARSLGWEMLNYDYQQTTVNNAEPCFQQSVNFEKALTEGQAKVLFYNSQVQNPSAKRMQSIAKRHGIAVVGITETQPHYFLTYVDWMLWELSMIEGVLSLLK
ncbi:MAG: zinc ABC transporter substrate-binding protein [Candidatus Xiphinematobacter sp.]|nr:MAG: zinc ABC transporter substrate-binding protein [Candidatus Xiphinematobacter sp.]